MSKKKSSITLRVLVVVLQALGNDKAMSARLSRRIVCLAFSKTTTNGAKRQLHKSPFSKSNQHVLEMTLPTTFKPRLVLTNYEEILNASKTFSTEPQLAKTTKIIVIDAKRETIDDTKKEEKNHAIATILTECSKHGVLEAFKWTGQNDSSTRPAEFWEALANVSPTLQHLSFGFHTHELHQMKKMGISVRSPIPPMLLILKMLFFFFGCSFRPSSLRHFLS